MFTLTYRVNVIPIKIPTKGAEFKAEARVSQHAFCMQPVQGCDRHPSMSTPRTHLVLPIIAPGMKTFCTRSYAARWLQSHTTSMERQGM